MSTIATARLGLSGSLPMRAARVPADVLSGGGVGWLLLVASVLAGDLVERVVASLLHDGSLFWLFNELPPAILASLVRTVGFVALLVLVRRPFALIILVAAGFGLVALLGDLGGEWWANKTSIVCYWGEPYSWTTPAWFCHAAAWGAICMATLLVAMHRLGVTLPALVAGTSLGFAIATGARQYLDGWPIGNQGYAQAALLGAIDGSFLYLGIRAVQRFRRLSTESVARKPPSGG